MQRMARQIRVWEAPVLELIMGTLASDGLNRHKQIGLKMPQSCLGLSVVRYFYPRNSQVPPESMLCFGLKSWLWIRRVEHRKHRLPKLVQTIAPSIPFPVFNPLYPQGILNL